MTFITDAQDVVETFGLMKGIWHIISTPIVKLGQKIFTKNVIRDYGYVILYRKISAQYKTRVTGVIIHEIEIRATRDYVTHYYGRYMHRGGKENSKLAIPSQHAGCTLDGIDGGYQKFTVQLKSPLAKGQTEKIIMENEWKENIQNESPAIPMQVYVPTLSLEFIITFPAETKITDARGEIRHQAGTHETIKTISLTPNREILTWKTPTPITRLNYRVTWNWS